MAQKSKASLGTVEDLLKRRPPEVRKWTMALRRLVRGVAPGVTERVYMGWRVIMYSREKSTPGAAAKMSKMFCGIGPLRNGVNLYFHQSAKLPDPDGLLEGTGKGMRHVKIRGDSDIRAAAVKTLVRAAYKLSAG